MELSEYVIDFDKRTAIKSEVLADVIADWTEPSSYTEGPMVETPWQIYCDRAWGVVGASVAAILKSPLGIKMKYAARIQFKTEAGKCSNNISKYEAILLGLRKLRALGVEHCIVNTDSKVASQIEKECIARDENLERYLASVRRMEKFFKGFTIQHIERNKNEEADELAKAAARKEVIPLDVFFQVIEDPSVKTVEPEPRLVNIIQGEDWRALIMAYLHNHYEPYNNVERTRMQQRAKAYQIIEEELYKTSVTRPLLHCLSKEEGKDLLTHIHVGVCGGHIGARALAAKVFRQGFYWPSIVDDAAKLVKTCQACQKFSPNTQALSQPTQLITPSWPLQRCGIDIVGPLAIAQGNYKFTVVAIEYFTKWIEAKPLVNIAAAGLKRFFWQNIICRFGVPREITVDNAKQFDCHMFKDFVTTWESKQPSRLYAIHNQIVQ
jgi:ribonuclease HI